MLYDAVTTEEDCQLLQHRIAPIWPAALESSRKQQRNSSRNQVRRSRDQKQLSERLSRIRAAYAGLPLPLQHRRYEAARYMGITEGELIAAHAGPASLRDGDPIKAHRLRPQWRRIADALPVLGTVRTIVGNAWCRLESTGAADKAMSNPQSVALAPPPVDRRTRDARAQPRAWSHGFAIEQRDAAGASWQSLQFFDPLGLSVAEVVLTEGSHVRGFHEIVRRFSTSEPATGLSAAAANQPRHHRIDPVIDEAAFRAAWSAMRSVNDLMRLRACSRLSFAGACRLAGPEFARELPGSAVLRLLEALAHLKLGMAVHVYGRTGYQSRRCEFNGVRVDGDVVRAEGPQHGLSLYLAGMHHVWLVVLPSNDGLRHSMVLLDKLAEPVVAFSGSALTHIMKGW